MKFITINDSLAPIRVLRQVDAITDLDLAQFLASELEFKRRETAAGNRWIDVFDCRTFAGLTEPQRVMIVSWILDNVAMLTESSLGVALTVPVRLEGHAKRIASHLERLEIPAHVGDDLDEALYWALERAYDEETWVAPGLVLGGIDALRQTMK